MLSVNFFPFPDLSTPRLLLRNISEADVNEIFFLRSAPAVMRYMDREPATSTSEAIKFIQKIKEALDTNKSITWAITKKGNPMLIGTICFWNIIEEHHRAEIGYILHPEHQRQGIMSEAVKSVLQYGFNHLKLHSVEANVNPENKSSIQLLERHGFTREAYFKENYFFNNTFLDSAIYSLLAPKVCL